MHNLSNSYLISNNRTLTWASECYSKYTPYYGVGEDFTDWGENFTNPCENFIDQDWTQSVKTTGEDVFGKEIW